MRQELFAEEREESQAFRLVTPESCTISSPGHTQRSVFGIRLHHRHCRRHRQHHH